MSVQRRHWGSGKVKPPSDELGGNVKRGVFPSVSTGVKKWRFTVVHFRSLFICFKICLFFSPQLAIIRCIHSPHKIPKIFRTSSQCIWMQLSSHAWGNWTSGMQGLLFDLGINSPLTTVLYLSTYCLFRQEGWRLEHENPSDPQSPLIFKGVVFNEMKGAFVSVLPHFCCIIIISIIFVWSL